MTEKEIAKQVLMRSLGAMGLGRLPDLNRYFIRLDQPELLAAVDELERKKLIRQIRVDGANGAVRGKWYARTDTLGKAGPI